MAESLNPKFYAPAPAAIRVPGGDARSQSPPGRKHSFSAADVEPEEEAVKLPPISALARGAPAVQGRDGRRYQNLSLYCLAPSSWPRRNCIYFVESRAFEPFILFVIIMNCVTMAMQSPLDPVGTPRAAIFDVRAAPIERIKMP